MANPCLQFICFTLGFLGWIAIIIATISNDWVITCKYGMNTCKRMDELGAKGLWTECVISTALYHCISLTRIFDLPAYIQTSRALMVTGSILGLPAMVLVLISMSCINLATESESTKSKHGVLGGVLLLAVGFCGMVSTVWFPIGAHQDQGLMSFGYSLYLGWLGTVFCLLSGCMTTCCSVDSSSNYSDNQRYYYSKQTTTSNPPNSTNHAKSAHV